MRSAVRYVWFALAIAGSATLARADVCTALFEKIDLPPTLVDFLSDPKIQSRVRNFETDREPFASFYREIESWLIMEKNVGKESKFTAKLRAPGAEPLLRVFKRSNYEVKAKLRVEKAGEIHIELDLGAVHATTPAAILDLQALELSVVNRLFTAFNDPVNPLKKVTLEWKLSPFAPPGFGEHMLSLGFGKDPKFVSRCSLPVGIAIGFASTLAGAAAGGGASILADTVIYWGDNPYGRIPGWSAIGGVGVGVLTTRFVCKQPTSRGGRYQLAFTRVVENPPPTASP